MEQHQHRKIACLEEIAYLNGWITKEDVMETKDISSMVFRERPGRDDSGRCGHHSAEEIPVPIPNTEVKLRDGDDSRKAKITNGHSDSRFPHGWRLFLSAALFPGLGAGRVAALSFCLIYSNACFFRGRMLRNVHGFPGRGTK